MVCNSFAMRLGLASCLLIGAVIVGCEAKTEPAVTSEAEPAAAKSGVVTMEVNLSGKITSFEIDGVADGATLESVMRGEMEVAVDLSGSGTTAFVNQIGDVATNGSEGWTFEVDGKWSDKGIGNTILHPPTTVTWEFGSWNGQSTDE